jgi:hypothetical protein
VNDHLTRRASRALDDVDCFLAGRASSTEHFDLSSSSGFCFPAAASSRSLASMSKALDGLIADCVDETQPVGECAILAAFERPATTATTN